METADVWPERHVKYKKQRRLWCMNVCDTSCSMHFVELLLGTSVLTTITGGDVRMLVFFFCLMDLAIDRSLFKCHTKKDMLNLRSCLTSGPGMTTHYHDGGEAHI